MELNIKDKERIPTKKPGYVKEQILQNKRKDLKRNSQEKGFQEVELNCMAEIFCKAGFKSR